MQLAVFHAAGCIPCWRSEVKMSASPEGITLWVSASMLHGMLSTPGKEESEVPFRAPTISLRVSDLNLLAMSIGTLGM